MSVIPCEKNQRLTELIRDYAEVLKTEAHKLGTHGLDEKEFYNSVFRGAIERVRGQFSATMRMKREFVRHVLNHMQDRGFILDWESAGESNRHDYTVRAEDGSCERSRTQRLSRRQQHVDLRAACTRARIYHLEHLHESGR